MINILKHNLNGITETLLIPLWIRARETRHSHPIIKDQKALEMMEQIDYDFSKFEHKRMPQVSIAIRTKLLDDATQDFMYRNPGGTIINIGCGLDTRYSRLDNRRVHWYDLDLPEPIHLREYFFKETSHYKMIASSVFDYSWVKLVKKDNPILIIIEGLLMYFQEDEVKNLLNKLVTSFPDAEMLCEVTTPLLVERYKKQDPKIRQTVPFIWGVKNGEEIEKFNGKIEFITEWNYYDYYQERRKEANIRLTREDSGRIVHLKFKG